MYTRASAYALAVHDGHVLLTQLAAYCTRPGHWSLPGGGIDHGEQPEEAVVREAMEETGLDALDLRPLCAHTYSETSEKRGDFMAVQIVYLARMEGTPQVLEVGGSTADARWVPLEALAELPTVPIVDLAMDAWRALPTG